MWTDDRCAELEQLRQLLRDVSAINNGSHCLERIARCIEIADALQQTDFTGRRSFYGFVEDLAIADRSARK